MDEDVAIADQEARLDVGQLHTEERAQDVVQHAAHQVAKIPRPTDVTAPPLDDVGVGVAKLAIHAVHVLGQVLQIAVHDGDVAAARGRQRALLPAAGNAVVAGVMHRADEVAARGQFVDQRPGVVRAGVVDENHLAGDAARLEHGARPFRQLEDVLPLIVAGDDDAQLDRGRHDSTASSRGGTRAPNPLPASGPARRAPSRPRPRRSSRRASMPGRATSRRPCRARWWQSCRPGSSTWHRGGRRRPAGIAKRDEGERRADAREQLGAIHVRERCR